MLPLPPLIGYDTYSDSKCLMQIHTVQVEYEREAVAADDNKEKSVSFCVYS